MQATRSTQEDGYVNPPIKGTRRASLEARAPHHNLPAHRVRLIGRESDLAAARQALLGAEGRLLTFTGTGGCGKTRLAVELASSLLDVFPDGVWLVELSPLSDPDLVPQAVFSALGLREQPGEAGPQNLVGWIGWRRLLLVLDNCEHLIDACAELAQALLDRCPNLRVLATSREPLRIRGELIRRVPSLPVPDLSASSAELLRMPAVQLFVERAQAVQVDFPAAARAHTVARICARVDGLPLAIELAAARARTLGVEQILSHLDDAIRLLVGGSRIAPARQQTLRATLEWSYGLLGSQERILFGRLAVFAGDSSLEAIAAVCAYDGMAQSDAMDLLHLLVDKSLVIMQEQNGVARYRLLEPLRQYARECLIADGDLELASRRHAIYYVDYGDARHSDTNRGGARRHAATAELSREYPNIRAALGWCVDTGESQPGLLLAGSLLFLWQIQGSTNEGFAWLSQLFELPGSETPSAARARGLVAAAFLARLRGDRNACRTPLPASAASGAEHRRSAARVPGAIVHVFMRPGHG
jgi:predicted ATPase